MGGSHSSSKSKHSLGRCSVSQRLEPSPAQLLATDRELRLCASEAFAGKLPGEAVVGAKGRQGSAFGLVRDESRVLVSQASSFQHI